MNIYTLNLPVCNSGQYTYVTGSGFIHLVRTIKRNILQRKHELISFKSLFVIKSFKSLFVMEAVFISEEIAECRFGALLEISDMNRHEYIHTESSSL